MNKASLIYFTANLPNIVSAEVIRICMYQLQFGPGIGEWA